MDKRDGTLSETNLYDIAERIVNASRMDYVDYADYVVKKTKLFVTVYKALARMEEISEDEIRAILDTKP